MDASLYRGEYTAGYLLVIDATTKYRNKNFPNKKPNFLSLIHVRKFGFIYFTC